MLLALHMRQKGRREMEVNRGPQTFTSRIESELSPSCRMSKMFEETQFIKAAHEIDNLELEGFDHFIDSTQENVTCKIYRRYQEESGLYDYKILGELLDVKYETCKAVYMDLDYRKTWDSYVKELYEVENQIGVIYWNVNYPFPMSNRDYIYRRELCELGQPDFKSATSVILAKAFDVPDIKQKSGVVRVTSYEQSLVIQSNGKEGTKAFMYYFDNPGGMIPTWLINWAAKTGVPSFMSSMRTACLGYDKYLQKKGRS